MELLKSYFRQMAELLRKEAFGGSVYFKDFGTLELEKYLSLCKGVSAKKTWFFRIDFTSGDRAVRYLFFFGQPSRSLRDKTDVALHISREEPSGSFHYERLDSLSAPNVPNIVEIGYRAKEESFIARGKTNAAQAYKIDEIGKRFMEEVIEKHFKS